MPVILALIVVSLTVPVHAAVPAWLVRLPESTQTVFVAETSAAAFHRFDRTRDGVAKTRRDYMSIGLGGVGKARAGDRRTPLGIYFVTSRLDTSTLHEKYGVTAFPLDYPNAWDRRLGRGGDGIWVHGVDPNGGTRPRRDTDGCIALPNARLSALAGSFEPNVTPVLIAERLAWAHPAEIVAVRSALEGAVVRWSEALRTGDMVAWLRFYDESFERWGMNRDEWAAFSLQTVGRRAIADVSVGELLILGDPVEDGLYLLRFRLEIAEAGGRKVVSTRRMYWRRLESGVYRIVAEDAG